MDSVTIVCARDGRNIQTGLSDKLHGIDTQVLTLPTSTSILPELSNGVLVLILTPQMCNDIKTASTDIVSSVITTPTRSVLLSACTETDKTRAVELLSRGVTSFSDVTMVDVANIGELHFAVAAIRTKLDAGNSTEHTPLVNKYVLQPEKLTQLDKELLIVLLEDRQNVRTVTARTDVHVNIDARKIKNDVWMLPTNGIPTGKSVIHVFADEVDLGPASLAKVPSIDTLSSLLPEVVRSCPLDLLSRTLNIDRYDVDSELGDILGDNHNLAFVKLLQGLLQFGYRRGADPESRPYPTLLHFCACHGLHRLCDWLMKDNKTDVGDLSTRNCDDMTPIELAKAGGFNALAEKLQEEEKENVFVRTDPPLINRDSFTTSPFSKTSVSLSAGSSSGQSALRQGASITGQARVSADSGLRSSSEYMGSSGDSIGSRGSGENRDPRRNRLPSDSATRGMTAILNADFYTPGPKTTSIDHRPREPLPMDPYLRDSEIHESPLPSPGRQHTCAEISDPKNREESPSRKSNSGAYNTPWDGQPEAVIPSMQRTLPEFGSPTSTEVLSTNM